MGCFGSRAKSAYVTWGCSEVEAQHKRMADGRMADRTKPNWECFIGLISNLADRRIVCRHKQRARMDRVNTVERDDKTGFQRLYGKYLRFKDGFSKSQLHLDCHFSMIQRCARGNSWAVTITTAFGPVSEFARHRRTLPRGEPRVPRKAGLANAVGDEGRMAKISENIAKARAAVIKPAYPLPEAVTLLKQVKYAKFDETVDLTMRLGVDTRHADQMVRGTVVLPHGLGKTKTVAVIATGDRQKEATEAGADFVGGEEMVEKIQKENWTAFDALIATPDMMKVVGRLGKVLGPKGLMPNPKTGTVTLDVAAAVKEIKAGKVEFRADKTSLVHVPVGKLSFDPQKLIDNATTVITSIVRAKPSAAKGQYIKSVTLSSTMGPGVPLDSAVADAAGKH